MRNLLRNNILPIRLRITGLIILNLSCSIQQMRYHLRNTFLNINESSLGNFFYLTDFIFLWRNLIIILNNIINKIRFITNLNGVCIAIINLVTKSILFFFLGQSYTLIILITEFQLLVIIRLLANSIPTKNIIFFQAILITIMLANRNRLIIRVLAIFINILMFI
jgi:hypothetical protein